MKLKEMGGNVKIPKGGHRKPPPGLSQLHSENEIGQRKVAPASSVRSAERPPSYQSNNQQKSSGLASPHNVAGDEW